MRYLLLSAAALTLAACGGEKTQDTKAATETPVAETLTPTSAPEAKARSLDEILAAQPDATKARYQYRNPKATLEYFGIKPGMTVAEVLPGGGWYSKIILPYLGDNGTYIGIDYSIDMWSKFGGFATAEFLENKKTWADTWTADATNWRDGSQTKITAFAFESMPKDLKGTADAVLMFRALHHLNRFDAEFWDAAIADTKAILKPGGIVGIVQHRSPEGNPDAWANGDNGYLKQSFVISKFEEAGFELASDPSEINGNPKDLPTADDTVWRLRPTLGTSRDNAELKVKMEAIGESDRMTLAFRKK